MNHLPVVVAITAALSLSACNSTLPSINSNQSAPNVNEVAAQPYNGNKARLSVARFSNKTHNATWYNQEIGDGMADQLTTALVNSGRFIVLERQALDEVLYEQDLATSGRIKAGTGASYGAIEGAELAVVAAVTEFDDDTGGVQAGGGGWLGSVAGAVSGGFKDSHIAVDLRLVDTSTSRILAATTVSGGSKDFNIGGAALGFFSSSIGVGGIKAWENTPKEKALRDVINKAVEYLISKVPEDYYRYNLNNQMADALPVTAPSKPVVAAKPAAAAKLVVTGNYGKEQVWINEPKRTQRDYGSVKVNTTKNADGLTEVVINQVLQQGSGGNLRKATVYLYQLDEQGNLQNQGEYLHSDNVEAIAAGKYYFKAKAKDRFFATGELTVASGVTNQISLTLE